MEGVHQKAIALVALMLVLFAVPAVANARVAETANPFTTDAVRQAVILFVPLDERAHGLLAKTFPRSCGTSTIGTR